MSKLAIAVIVAGVLFAGPAFAQFDDPDGGSPISGVFELKLGEYVPNIDGDFDVEPGPFESVFSNRTGLYLEGEYDWQFYRGVGSAAIAVNAGFFRDAGNAQLADGSSSADTTYLRMFPLRLGLAYRFDYLQTRYRVPVALSVKAGVDYYFWRVGGSGGLSQIGEFKGRGGTAGYHVELGFHLLLDAFAPSMAAGFDGNAGVNNTYFFAEYLIAMIDDFGGDASWDLSDNTALFGLAFEF